MTVAMATLFALVVSLLSLLYLSKTDPKRRRVHDQPVWHKARYQKVAWLLSMLPGGVLLSLGAYAAFIMWFAAFSLIGWLVAIPKPKKINQI